MNETMLGNGVLVTGGEESSVVPRGAVVWSGERIREVGEEEALRARYPEARYLDARGGLILSRPREPSPPLLFGAGPGSRPGGGYA